MYYVYILRCDDDTFYTGITNDIEKRLYSHNNLKSGAHYTKIRRPVTLLYSESYPDKSSALKREIEIKKMSREGKEGIIKNI